MPAGRPSKYNPLYCNEVIECLAEGHSVTAFAGRIGVSRATVFNWTHDHPEFLDALKIGQSKAVEFWENILVGVARESQGNATAAIFGLKNRAADDWSDKSTTEITGKDGGPIETADVTSLELARRVAFLLALGAQKQDVKEIENG